MKTSFFYGGVLIVSFIFSFPNIASARGFSFGIANTGKKPVTAEQLKKINEVFSGKVSDVTLKRSLETAAKENAIVGQELLELSEKVELDIRGEMGQEDVESAVSFLVNVRTIQPAKPQSSNPKAANVARDIINHVSDMFAWPKENFDNAIIFLKAFNAAKKAGLRNKNGGWVSAAVSEGFRVMNKEMTGQRRYYELDYRRWKKEAREFCRI